MNRTFLVCALSMLALPRSLRAEPAAHSFTFFVPDGWIDLRDGASADAAALTADVREARERGTGDRVMFAAAPNEDVVMGAFLRPESESEPVDADALTRAAKQLATQGGFAVAEKHIETVDGVAWGRFAGETAKQSRFVVYLVPGRPRSAFIMFSAPPASFDRRLPEFENAAKRTRGAAVPEHKSHFPFEAVVLGSLGGAALLWRFTRAKRKSAESPKRSARLSP